MECISSPDEKGETTLDAMIMDGETHDVGAVGCLKEVRGAISVARSVMEHTKETFLVGEDASDFAVEMGFQRQSLETNHSLEIWKNWIKNDCQPNYWNQGTVTPDPTTSCGPYKPTSSSRECKEKLQRPPVDEHNHDTIGMIVIDADRRIACGTSTNGATHKIPGRVGDSPITGAGCYVEKGVGGAAATGDGDVMMRFLPTYQVVESMRRGISPTAAAEEALQRIAQYYPSFVGALVAVNISGSYGAANHGFGSFDYTVYTPQLGNSTVIHLK